MKSKISFILILFVCIIFMIASEVQSSDSNGLKQFVNNAIKELNSAPFKIPKFKDAVIDTIVSIDSANKIENTNLHLCWLKNDKGRVGYIAVAESNSSLCVVAFSATTAPPDYFLKNLKLTKVPEKQLRLSTAKQESFVENVPLVATAKTTIGTDTIEISEIACSVSSLFNYFQHKDKHLMFGHFDSSFNSDPEYTQRFLENSASARSPGDPNWKSFDDEAKEATKKANIPQNVKLNEQTPEQRVSLRNQVRQIVKPIIRRRLLNPANAAERLQVIIYENNTITNTTRTDISNGMRDSIVLQQDYLDGNISNLEKNLTIFIKTRGRTAQIDTIPFEKMQSDSLPVILIGTDNIAGIILGFLDIDGAKYAFVFFPKTSKPSIMSFTEKAHKVRIANNLPAETDREKDPQYQEALKLLKEAEEKQQLVYKEKGLSNSTKEKSAEEKVQESVQLLKDFYDKTMIVEDTNSKYPEGLENGIQIVKCSNLSTWQVLKINSIKIGDNW